MSLCVVMYAVVASVQAQTASDYAVQVSAVAQTNPASIALSWPADLNATDYTLCRKSRDATSWGAGVPLPGTATNYLDANVSVGGAYEYLVSKNTSSGYGEGCVYAGIAVPFVETRGKVVLVVDNTFSMTLSNELVRLQQDLVGDGWTVLRHDVARMAVDPANTSSSVWASRSNEVANVKALIKADYYGDPTTVKAVFLLGHVPVPYSGGLAPDEHSDHSGAWPADGYYGDMNGSWTDSTLTYTLASDARNWNVPGDGKLDQSFFPSSLELQVGRVDFANLPVFPQSEAELLRQYLNKDHNFRHMLVTAGRRGLIDDQFGLSTGEPLAANGWRNFAPFFGATNSFASSEWFGVLSTNSYLWGYGCGAGTYTSCGGIGSTTDFANHDPRVVFTMFFGSYFGDWDSQNNFMRAALATPTYTLTCAWVGRPNWPFHHMGLGEAIGFSTRLAQNNNGVLYWSGSFSQGVHVALLGDPTLRMHMVAPVSGLAAIRNGNDAILSWNTSPDSVLGYHVYGATSAAGPFTRLNGSLLTGTNYTDTPARGSVYMVRAVKLEVSGSGSYYNASQGVFQAPGPSTTNVPAPLLTITNLLDGHFLIQGTGVPGVPYRIEFATDISQTNWQTLGSATGDLAGVFVLTNYSPSPQGFYRSIYP